MLLAVWMVLPSVAKAQLDGGQVGARPAAGSGSGGAPGVVTIAPGANLATYNWQNDTAYQLGDGTYTVTPSIWKTNNTTGTVPAGIKLFNLTNVTLSGVPGQTVISGTSTPGEVLMASNCFNLRIGGITFYGYTNHSLNEIQCASSNLVFAGLLFANCDGFYFENCRVERFIDNGLGDVAQGYLTAANLQQSTNVFIRNNYFRDIGGWFTNMAGGAHISDGVACAPLQGVIEGNTFENVFRAIEPFNVPPGVNKPFRVVIRNNRIKNVVDYGITTFGTTNAYDSVIEGNFIENAAVWSYHGTNYGVTFSHIATGIYIGSGQRWMIARNTVYGGFQTGIAAGLVSAMPMADCFIIDNLVSDINTTGGQGSGFYLGDPSNVAASTRALLRATISGNKAIRTQDAGFALWAGRDINLFDNTVINCNLAGNGGWLGAGFLLGYDGYSTALLTNINARGNTVYTDTANAPRIPFYIADNVSSMRMVDFYTYTNGSATAASASNGITNRSGNNVTILGPVRTYNSAVNLASIAANTGVDTVITAAGVTTNDAITVQIPPQFWVGGAGGEVNLFAWATNSTSSDGQIVLRAINSDTAAATVDFPSVNMIFQARQVRVAGQ